MTTTEIWLALGLAFMFLWLVTLSVLHAVLVRWVSHLDDDVEQLAVDVLGSEARGRGVGGNREELSTIIRPIGPAPKDDLPTGDDR